MRSPVLYYAFWWNNRCTRQFSSSNGINNNHDAKHAAHILSALSSGPLPYERGWAWQHVLLNRRLNFLRLQQRLNQDGARNNAMNLDGINLNNLEYSESNKDWVLLFEHEPVYTLGRGASEEHLTFLSNEPDGENETRRRLSRKYRGVDASRLNIDQLKNHSANNTIENTISEGKVLTVEDEVNALLSNIYTPPVYAPNGAPIYRIERGGEVTYHGPGQLVLYPLLHLKQAPPYKSDLHWYLRQIEEVVIQTLKEFDIEGIRDDINTGVWVDKRKIAAVGVSSSRWITTHGCAINVCPNLNHFDKDIITPCGIEEREVTSISEVLGGGNRNNCPTVNEVADVAVKCFGKVFDVELVKEDVIQ